MKFAIFSAVFIFCYFTTTHQLKEVVCIYYEYQVIINTKHSISIAHTSIEQNQC